MSKQPTPIKPLPGIEAHALPVPTLPEIPNPISVETSLETPSFLRIRKFLTKRALNASEADYLEDVRHDTVIRATALGAQLQHGFYKGIPGHLKVEPDHVRPLRASEKVTSVWRQRQVSKKLEKEHAGHNAISLYESRPDYTTFLPDDYDSMTLDQKNWEDMKAKLKAASAPKVSIHEHVRASVEGEYDAYGHIIVPPAKMPLSTKKAHARNIRKYDSAHTASHSIQGSLDKGAQGDTMSGKRRNLKIKKGNEKILKLQRKNDNYDRLEYLRNIKNEDARVNKTEINLRNSNRERAEHLATTRSEKKVRGKLHDIKRATLDTNVSRNEKRLVSRVPIYPGSARVEAPGIRQIQENFGEKWAADIHRQLVRSENGRDLIRDQFGNIT
ncbi:MAG: hypothetical protein WCO19_02925 [Candidatus Saccharibacteria bacterium]